MIGAKQARERMVAEQIAARGIRHPEVLAAMREVPRHCFVPKDLVDAAYGDSPLPIGEGQTISQPYMVAFMTAALRPTADMLVLELGTGCGYQAAILSKLVREVISFERRESLAEAARRRLFELGISNVTVIHDDGWDGLPQRAPFDAILLAAATPEQPTQLMQQLAHRGRIVFPSGQHSQRLIGLERSQQGWRRIDYMGVRFVPLVRGLC